MSEGPPAIMFMIVFRQDMSRFFSNNSEWYMCTVSAVFGACALHYLSERAEIEVCHGTWGVAVRRTS